MRFPGKVRKGRLFSMKRLIILSCVMTAFATPVSAQALFSAGYSAAYSITVNDAEAGSFTMEITAIDSSGITINSQIDLSLPSTAMNAKSTYIYTPDMHPVKYTALIKSGGSLFATAVSVENGTATVIQRVQGRPVPDKEFAWTNDHILIDVTGFDVIYIAALEFLRSGAEKTAITALIATRGIEIQGEVAKNETEELTIGNTKHSVIPVFMMFGLQEMVLKIDVRTYELVQLELPRQLMKVTMQNRAER